MESKAIKGLIIIYLFLPRALRVIIVTRKSSDKCTLRKVIIDVLTYIHLDE